MNILYVITKSSRGGAQQHVRDLAIAFQDQKNTVTVAIGEKGGWLHDQLTERGIGVEYVRLSRTWNPLVFFAYMIDLMRILKNIKPEIVHFHSSHTLIGTWIVRFCFTHIKSIVTVHGLSLLYPGAAKKWIQAIYAFFLRSVFLSADRVISVCLFDKKILLEQKLVTQNNIEMIHNGVFTPAFFTPEEARMQIGLPLGVTIIGTLARFSYQKNLSFLIESFAAWNHPSALLCLIGSGTEEGMLKQLVRDQGIEDRVFFRQGDATVLKAFSCFVLSSRYEGFPYVLLESALAQVPLIATNVGGVSELIEQNQTGWLIPSSDIPALVQALNDVVFDADRAKRYARAAQARVQSNFMIESMIQKIDRLYQSLND
ncbi:hypothetical protein A3E97_05435 [Candidatus Uhrbacteria bacterium RIFCSPHIGHO2_12_FULL_47_12]|uniref:Glycosyltransferase subfamily 4-like N-terminal domain-containing protein n=1 Tax=Candidatus Uhrbacteria bacterium RIFCSPLOWO2_02_FULL_48_18 TaxID=1802408 RepID=A0A1F7V946_9BACT|nr:MAG: hypothetical protein A2839_03655 [Candidatus Uhrbacteria bacterium RIFCSPHIGHO2_01_FULL_47_10]OGL77210.1 MAG: hypothetical protein A3E97_05435 [Candidatus Uhrbacteria bacterium RIFCSPHIGHO2_12_FULL_47_12]OGL81876.1 MAG: hypothetical protein A3B20_02180 [Candidatus Uhrbacteria bacterium RIFCSPLOWO2_01_FULL_47_17]OGL87039.1 MAG: hypothetical protein A3I41_03770 [Candidatus Uhrbacteria bacterium RIFCSPLOWO2_02_FULL_48_18]OGL92747.1 MAG: hypothetical protein A3H12_03725 [Candidatus Uhrbacte